MALAGWVVLCTFHTEAEEKLLILPLTQVKKIIIFCGCCPFFIHQEKEFNDEVCWKYISVALPYRLRTGDSAVLNFCI